MPSQLLNYYEAIEQASQDMLEAARNGNWDQVVKLEGACALLISQLKHAAAQQPLPYGLRDLRCRIRFWNRHPTQLFDLVAQVLA